MSPLLLVLCLARLLVGQPLYDHGALVRGDTALPQIALVFTGDEFGDGMDHIAAVLDSFRVRASFFLTGRFYRNPAFADGIKRLQADGHYLGAHSDRHLLYCSWENRDSLLVSEPEFKKDLRDNYMEMKRFDIGIDDAAFFLPAYEWYNSVIADWTHDLSVQLINYTPGTRSHADYTTPDMGDRYVPSLEILDSIVTYEKRASHGLNGFILLSHIGVDPKRTDKFYLQLGSLITTLSQKGYEFVRIDQLLAE